MFEAVLKILKDVNLWFQGFQTSFKVFSNLARGFKVLRPV
jgi:hypothetical protein